jgi:hypothetical protein
MTQPAAKSIWRPVSVVILPVNQKSKSQFQWQQIGSMKLDPEATGSKKSPYSIRQQ